MRWKERRNFRAVKRDLNAGLHGVILGIYRVHLRPLGIPECKSSALGGLGAAA